MLTLYMNFFFVVNAMPENDTLTLVSIVVTVVSIFVTIWTSGGRRGGAQLCSGQPEQKQTSTGSGSKAAPFF